MTRALTVFQPLFAAILFALPILVGCGGSSSGIEGPTGTVSGKITHEGKPFPAGSRVQFYLSSKGFGATGELDQEGQFQVQTPDGSEVPVGTYSVSITPPAGPVLTPEEQMKLYNEGKIKDEHPEIPQKLRDPQTSGVTFEVKEGENVFNHDFK